MNFYEICPNNTYKIKQIYKNTNGVPFWSFYVNAVMKTQTGRQLIGSVKIVCFQRQFAEEGDVIKIDSIDAFRMAKRPNKKGGYQTFYSLVCTLSKPDNYEMEEEYYD